MVDILPLLDYLYAVIALAFTLFFIFQKNIKQYTQAHTWNWTRSLLMFTIFSHWIGRIMKLLINLDIIASPYWRNEDITIFSPIVLIYVSSIMFGSWFAFYVNGWHHAELFPVFMYVGGIIFYIATSITIFSFYIYIGGAITILALYQAAFSVRDNNTLALAIFYSLNTIGTMIDYSIPVFILNIFSWTLCILIALNKIHIFREKGGR